MTAGSRQSEAAPDTREALWSYAVALYEKPAVKESCLDLQDRCRLDVNLLLFAVWHALCGRARLDANACRECMAMTRPWREAVIEPLRRLRRTSAAGADALAPEARKKLARQLLSAELEAERVEIHLLADWAARRPVTESAEEPAALAASNLVACLAAAGVAPGSAAQSVRAILAAAVPDT